MNFPVPPMYDEDRKRRPKRKTFARLALLLIVVGMAGTGVYAWSKQSGHIALPPGAMAASYAETNDTMARAPTGIRVKVRVINTTKSDGLARRATAVLRDHGFDVVDYDGDSRAPRDSTLVMTHTGHADWGARAVRALGTGSVTANPDTSRYIDLTVMLGRDWKAPSQPLRP